MQQPDRLHALDAIRAFALLLGIFFHAACSFVVALTNGAFVWAIADNSPSITLGIFVGLTHVFRMSLFFFVAGLFAHLVYHRKGAAEFARNRVIRIVVPFVIGWIVMTPLLSWIWNWGRLESGLMPVPSLWPSAASWATGEISLAHLWFLYYLMLIYVLIVGARHLLADRFDEHGTFRARVDSLLRKAVDKHWAALVFSIPMAIAAVFSFGWMGSMPTPDHSLFPELLPLAGYGAAFFGGWLFHRDLGLLQLITERAKTSLYGMLITGVLSAAAGTMMAMQPNIAPTLFRSLSAFFGTAMMWYFNFWLIGFALKKFSHMSARTRYVADASYWLYIAHLPLVVALQVWVAHWQLHWTIKYPFIVTVAFVLLFGSYHYLVRYSFIGALLNGRKHSRESLSSSTPVLN